jgi:hypothetical protein
MQVRTGHKKTRENGRLEVSYWMCKDVHGQIKKGVLDTCKSKHLTVGCTGKWAQHVPRLNDKRNKSLIERQMQPESTKKKMHRLICLEKEHA